MTPSMLVLFILLLFMQTSHRQYHELIFYVWLISVNYYWKKLQILITVNLDYHPIVVWIWSPFQNKSGNSQNKLIQLQWKFLRTNHTEVQHCLWPPQACMTSIQRWADQRTKFSWKIHCQAWMKASASSWAVCGMKWRHYYMQTWCDRCAQLDSGLENKFFFI